MQQEKITHTSQGMESEVQMPKCYIRETLQFKSSSLNMTAIWDNHGQTFAENMPMEGEAQLSGKNGCSYQ